GAEHAVLHLMYARFFTKALFDGGMVSFDEPFLKLKNQGLILGGDGQKMSKSRGNVINPDDVVTEHGADTLRLYEMFMGEFEAVKPWDKKGILGVCRFLDRVWTVCHDVVHQRRDSVSPELERALHKTVKKVSRDIEDFRFNTAISAMMILMNEWQSLGGGSREFAATFLKILAPFAPHLAEDLWQLLAMSGSVFQSAWPTWNEALTVDAKIELVVQVNGKLRDKMEVDAGLGEEDLKARALGSEKVRQFIDGKHIVQVVVARGRLVNIVVT
ncbi:MAG: class I tRNA ligase family protein, partial [Patescibacteria group bacterium]